MPTIFLSFHYVHEDSLSHVLDKANEGGFSVGFLVGKREGEKEEVSQLLFVDDTIILCDVCKEKLEHLSWALIWFGAISGLKINLEKSELIPVGLINDVEDPARVLGCKLGTLLTSYLRMPYGAPFKSYKVWDVVEGRFQKCLALWKRQYLSKGARPTLINNTLSSLPIYFTSLFAISRKVSLRFETIQRDFLWAGGGLEKKAHLVK